MFTPRYHVDLLVVSDVPDSGCLTLDLGHRLLVTLVFAFGIWINGCGCDCDCDCDDCWMLDSHFPDHTGS
jgi:hypothetical protein